MKACMMHAGFTQSMKNRMWTEVIATVTKLQNLLGQKDGGKLPCIRLYGKLPRWGRHLKEIGQMGIVRNIKENKSKLEKRGFLMMMVGYH